MDIIISILLFFLVSVIIALVILIIYEIIKAIYHKTLRYETFRDNAKVCNKEYEEEYTSYVIAPIYHDETFNVYLMYEGEQYCFEDKDLYNSVNISDNVRVLVHKGYNKKEELKHVYLSIEK